MPDTKRKPTGLQWIGRMSDFPKYQDAIDSGYAGSYDQWIKEGKPKGGAPLSARTRAIMGTPEHLLAQAEREAGIFGQPPIVKKPPPAPTTPAIQPRKPSGLTEAQERLTGLEELYGKGSYYIDYNNETQEYEVKRDPKFFEQKRKEDAYPLQPGQPQTYTDAAGKVMSYDTDTNSYIQIGYDQTKDQAYQADKLQRGYQGEESRLNREARAKEFAESMAWQREEATARQTEQNRQYTAQLAAQPMSWLQYASYTGQAPVVQPWMLPLMSGQYNIGQAIPNWTSGQTQSMSTLPELRNPSMQYWGRMGPTAQQQYMGYQQARTGIRPEESMFRQRATAPPSGAYSGLRWMR